MRMNEALLKREMAFMKPALAAIIACALLCTTCSFSAMDVQASSGSGGSAAVSEHEEEGNSEADESQSAPADEKQIMSADEDLDAVVDAMLEPGDFSEAKAVQRAAQKVSRLGRAPRIIATSPAVADVCDRLELDLVGVCSSTISTIPSRYDGLTQVGTAMSPDMEIVSSLSPDWILSPVSLQSDLEPKYDNIGADWAFLNTRSVQGLYRSIRELGQIFGRETQAERECEEFRSFYKEYAQKNVGKEHPTVLILMGLPGSYIIATENSYVGSLVELAGGENVYAGTNQEFLTVNTEDMKTKEPDVILRAAHALPDQVVKMFEEDFETNDIWKHFEAVKEGRVYDLTYDYFGMSAKFNYPDALEELQPMLYPESDADVEAAAENSAKARAAAAETASSAES